MVLYIHARERLFWRQMEGAMNTIESFIKNHEVDKVSFEKGSRAISIFMGIAVTLSLLSTPIALVSGAIGALTSWIVYR